MSTFYAANDFIQEVTIMDVDATGTEVPVSTGTVTAFLATSNGPTATAADASLSVSAVYTGAGGVWLATFDKTAMLSTLLDSLFPAGVTPYLIVENSGGIRVYVTCSYKASRPASTS
jgi:hypothetical protein